MTRDTNVLTCPKIEEANPIFIIRYRYACTMILWVNYIIKNLNNIMLLLRKGLSALFHRGMQTV